MDVLPDDLFSFKSGEKVFERPRGDLHQVGVCEGFHALADLLGGAGVWAGLAVPVQLFGGGWMGGWMGG